MNDTRQCKALRRFCSSYGSGDVGDDGNAFFFDIVCENHFQSDFDVGQKFGALKAKRQSDGGTNREGEMFIYLRPRSEHSRQSVSISIKPCRADPSRAKPWQSVIIIIICAIFCVVGRTIKLAQRELSVFCHGNGKSKGEPALKSREGLVRIIFNWLETLNANYSCGR